MHRRSLYLPLSAILLSVALAACGAAGTAAPPTTATHNVSLVLDWYPNSDHGGLYTAISRGYFARRHIVMHAYTPSNTSAQIPLVASGRADFGISYEADLLAARARGIPVRSVMCIMQHPLDTVMTLRSSGITRPRDLQGHTVGMGGSPSDIPIVSAMVRHDGGSMSRVRMVNVGYNLRQVLLARKVDAVIGVYWTWEAIQARQAGFPVNVMRVERWGAPNYCELVLVAGESTIRSRPQLVRSTVQALQAGYAYAEAHPQAAYAALRVQDKSLSSSLVVPSLKLLRTAVVDSAPTIGWANGRQWATYARWLVTNHMLNQVVDARSAFTNRFLAPGVR